MSEVDRYDYHLPRELIAQHPLARRTDARLLVVRRATETLEHFYMRDLPELLSPGDCCVVNDTRVIPARLLGKRARTGGRWEGLFLGHSSEGQWRVMSKTRGHLEPGEQLLVQDHEGVASLTLHTLLKNDDGTWIVQPESTEPWLDVLERVGRVPLPPYIRGGQMLPGDVATYQTTYATQPGAVAAPTAGLHFTPELFQRLAGREIGRASVTLHVGMGTFRPITAERLEDHDMHSEWGSISAEVAERLKNCRARKGRIVAVGTTSVRVLETAAREGDLREWSGETNLFIRPPYEFRAVDALLTNFHLPRSTLLVLVRTFGGDALIRRAYGEAIHQRYRFYSYGDAMLIL